MKTNIKGVLKTVQRTLRKNSPALLTGAGIGGMLTTVVLAVRATPKAIEKIKAYKEEAAQNGRPLTKWQTVKLCWKCYLPATVTGAASVACLVGANTVSGRRNAALATAYSLSENALNDYREKVTQVVGEKKEQAIRDEVAKETLARHPVVERDIITTGKGNTLCRDNVSGRYFYSDMETLRRAENEINRRMRDEMYIPLNDFYDEIPLPPIGVGNDLGWTIDKGYLDLRFSAQLTENGEPCLLMDYALAPEYGFKDRY